MPAAASLRLACQKAPGFAILFVAGVASGVGVEAESFAPGEGLDGDDIPDVLRNDVSRDEVNVVGGVGITPPRGFDAIAIFGATLGGFDLNAPESVAGADQKIVGMSFSPRLGDVEVEQSNASQKGGLDRLAETFAGRMSDDGLAKRERFVRLRLG